MSVHPLTYNNDLSCLTTRGSIQKVHNNRIKDQKTIAAEDYETQLKPPCGSGYRLLIQFSILLQDQCVRETRDLNSPS